MNRKLRKRGGPQRGGRRSTSPRQDLALKLGAFPAPAALTQHCAIPKIQAVTTRPTCTTCTATPSAPLEGGHRYWDGGDVPRSAQRKRSYRQRLAKCLGCEECAAARGDTDGG